MRSFLINPPRSALARRAAANAWACPLDRMTTTLYRRGVPTRSHDLDTRRKAELDSKDEMKGEREDVAENASSDTLRAGWRIS